MKGLWVIVGTSTLLRETGTNGELENNEVILDFNRILLASMLRMSPEDMQGWGHRGGEIGNPVSMTASRK